MREISCSELAAWRADPGRIAPVVVDVREAWELARARLDDVVHIPMNAIPSSLERLDPDAPTVCVCHHGARSMHVAHFLERNGFSDVFNLTGGIDAWAVSHDPSVGRY
ncbi:MAG: rhodanese-like domain-containing protein [Lautropia sp.]